MKKIIVFNLISLDGFFARLNGDIDWHNVDDEFNKFAIEQLNDFGTIIFGRTTYKIFEDFWPKAVDNPKFSKEDHKIAEIIDNINKIVFSKTLDKVIWKNSKLFKEINPSEIKKLKDQPGKDMVVFGSGSVVQALTNLRLIDEYRLLVNPIILGRGKPMFNNVKEMKLKLLKTRNFRNGNILLYYQPIK